MFARKTFCVVTGATRGYGKTMVEMLAARLNSGSVLVLTARNGVLLDGVRQQLADKHPSLRAFCWQSDLTTPCSKQYSAYFHQLFQENNLKAEDFEQCLLVHNAGSVGDISRTHLETTDLGLIDAYWRMNVTSVLLLNATVLPLFTAYQHRYVINISSLCSIKPFKGFSLYCAGKAAREQMLNCLAKENADLRLLHWAPGPLATDMTSDIGPKLLDAEMTTAIVVDYLLTCEQSANKLMALLEKDTFQNSCHIDYYDIDEQGNFLIPGEKK